MTEEADRAREPEPSLGPDEEGEVPIDAVPNPNRHGAWVRVDEARHREEVQRRSGDGDS